MQSSSVDTFESSILRQLSTLDRFLPLWTGLAMAAGLALGRVFPDLNDQLDRVKIDQTTSLPIAIGLLGMMYPVLAKVRYDRIRDVTTDRPLLVSSLVLNWLFGPALMFALAWIFLPDLPEFRTGIILVGLARCIAMVLIWNSLACGDTEAAAVLVVLNSVFQVAAYAFLGYFYLETLPGWLGLEQTAIDFELWDIARSVLIFLGIPLLLGALTSVIGRCRKGDVWYEREFLPRIGPWALYSLLFTVVITLRHPRRNHYLPAARCRSDLAAPPRLFRIDVDGSVRVGAGHSVRRRAAILRHVPAGGHGVPGLQP